MSSQTTMLKLEGGLKIYLVTKSGGLEAYNASCRSCPIFIIGESGRTELDSKSTALSKRVFDILNSGSGYKILNGQLIIHRSAIEEPSPCAQSPTSDPLLIKECSGILNLKGAPITASNFKLWINKYQSNSDVHSLEMSQNTIQVRGRDFHTLMKCIASFINLNHLNLEDSELSVLEIYIFCETISKMPQLKSIALFGQPIDQFLLDTAQGKKPKTTNFENQRLGDLHAAAISFTLRHCPPVANINLKNNVITDLGVLFLVSSPVQAGICTRFDLENNNVTTLGAISAKIRLDSRNTRDTQSSQVHTEFQAKDLARDLAMDRAMLEVMKGAMSELGPKYGERDPSPYQAITDLMLMSDARWLAMHPPYRKKNVFKNRELYKKDEADFRLKYPELYRAIHQIEELAQHLAMQEKRYWTTSLPKHLNGFVPPTTSQHIVDMFSRTLIQLVENIANAEEPGQIHSATVKLALFSTLYLIEISWMTMLNIRCTQNHSNYLNFAGNHIHPFFQAQFLSFDQLTTQSEAFLSTDGLDMA